MSTSTSDLVEIALFPIPGCVCFPTTIMPLHVFEPRYRAMIKDSVRLGRRIGVSHTVKEISGAKRNQTKADILNTNQETYEAEKIFSAGFAEIEEVTADGRMGVKIKMDSRYESVEEIQTLPYRIDRCRLFKDQESNLTEAADLKLKVLKRLQVQLASGSAEVRELFEPARWESFTPEDFSFRIFSVVRVETELSQALLEMRSPEARLKSLLRVLDQNGMSPDSYQ